MEEVKQENRNNEKGKTIALGDVSSLDLERQDWSKHSELDLNEGI